MGKYSKGFAAAQNITAICRGGVLSAAAPILQRSPRPLWSPPHASGADLQLQREVKCPGRGKHIPGGFGTQGRGRQRPCWQQTPVHHRMLHPRPSHPRRPHPCPLHRGLRLLAERFAALPNPPHSDSRRQQEALPGEMFTPPLNKKTDGQTRPRAFPSMGRFGWPETKTQADTPALPSGATQPPLPSSGKAMPRLGSAS